MKLRTLPASALLAVLIGAVHTYLLAWAWVYIAIHSPWPHWLASQGATGASFYGTLFLTDFLTNAALCVPAAYLLCKLRPAKLWVYLVAAILPGFLWQYRLVLGDLTLLGSSQLYLLGALLAVLPLPTTALLIRRFVTGAPNNSFKPKPLRSSKGMA